MSDFIADVLGKRNADDGMIVVVRVTGFGAPDGPLMSRAKARAIASSRFGRDQVSYTERIDEPGKFGDTEREITATKDEFLHKGPIDNVRDKLKAFRRDGLLAEVKEFEQKETTKVVSEDELMEVFGKVPKYVNTYQYEILVTTSFSFI